MAALRSGRLRIYGSESPSRNSSPESDSGGPDFNPNGGVGGIPLSQDLSNLAAPIAVTEERAPQQYWNKLQDDMDANVITDEELRGLKDDMKVKPETLKLRNEMRHELMMNLIDDEVEEAMGGRHLRKYEWKAYAIHGGMRPTLPHIVAHPDNIDGTPHDAPAARMFELREKFKDYRPLISDSLIVNTPWRFKSLEELEATFKHMNACDDDHYLERLRKLAWVIDVMDKESVRDTVRVLRWLAGREHFGYLLPSLEYVHFHFEAPKGCDVSVKWFPSCEEFRTVVREMKGVRMRKAVVTGMVNEKVAKEIEQAIMLDD